MKYTIESDRMDNRDGCRKMLNRYEVEAMSEMDAVIRATKRIQAEAGAVPGWTPPHETGVDYLQCRIIVNGLEVGQAMAYLMDNGTFEFHLYSDGIGDIAFTL